MRQDNTRVERHRSKPGCVRVYGALSNAHFELHRSGRRDLTRWDATGGRVVGE